MRIAITGGTGLVGGHLARALSAAGHETVLIARGVDKRNPDLNSLPGSALIAGSINDASILSNAFQNCNAVVHCAGINRERGSQTYQKVHIEGTCNVVAAAKASGVKKIVLISFLRARPNCGSGYHESKWVAEELVRESGLDYTILKEGITYGRGDHMLAHLSWALRYLPVFAFVGFREKPIRPVAVQDLVEIIMASLLHGRLSRETVAVVGPESMPLSAAVRRVADVINRHPLFVRLPVWGHKILAVIWEALMDVPLASRAQVFILSEGIEDPAPTVPFVPDDLMPKRLFNREQILAGLPSPT